jgi:hypothetical protein
LVAAVPAAVLGFFLVGTFLNQLKELQERGTMYLALYGTTLAACAFVAFLPLGVLIFGPKSRSASKSSGAVPKPKSKTVKAASETGEQSVVGESLEPGMSGEFAAPADKGGSTGELEIVEATPSMENLAAYDDEAIPPSGEIVAAEDDFAFDEEPVAPPKKKKGK